MERVARRRVQWVAGVLAVAALVAGCSSSDSSSGNRSADASTTTAAAQPADTSALSWDQPAATEFNGALPAADPATVCGANDRRFLGELLEGNPLEYKVPKRLAEVKPAPSQIVISGTAEEPSIGEGDFPFDHTTGSDFNMNVKLDQPFMGVGQENAQPIDRVHVELAEGQLPHVPGPGNPATLTWEQMSERSREGLQQDFLPRAGDRVLVMGTWIVDCGHENFQTELHPITFMAVARTEGDATVVHTFYNPYRETQLYNADPAKTTNFAVPGRLDDPTNVPFPKALVDSIARVALGQPPASGDAAGLASWAVMAPNTVAPVIWNVCPPGQPASSAQVGAAMVVRDGAAVDVAPAGGCAKVTIDLSAMTPAEPTMHVCTTPWEFLSKVAGEEAAGQEREGETSIDLRKEIGKFLPEAVTAKLSADPVMNCYDPMMTTDAGGGRPTTVEITRDPAAEMPFAGVIAVRATG